MCSDGFRRTVARGPAKVRRHPPSNNRGSPSSLRWVSTSWRNKPGDSERDVDPLLVQESGDPSRFGVRRRNHQSCASRQRPPDLPGLCVEVEPADLQHRLAPAWHHGSRPFNAAEDVSVLDHHALGAACRAGRVHDVCERLRWQRATRQDSVPCGSLVPTVGIEGRTPRWARRAPRALRRRAASVTTSRAPVSERMNPTCAGGSDGSTIT